MNIKQLRQFCSTCKFANLCLPVGLDPESLAILDTLITKQKIIPKDHILFNTGSTFQQLIAVRSGAFKTFCETAEGKQNIVSFYLPGELFGFDGVASGHYQVTAQATETSSICEIPFDKLLMLAGHIPVLQRQLLTLVSQQTIPDIAVQLNSTAEERLIEFLLSISKRYKNTGYSEKEFNLPMSREDIANYLGLAPETISRLLSRLEARGLLQIHRRHVILHIN